MGIRALFSKKRKEPRKAAYEIQESLAAIGIGEDVYTIDELYTEAMRNTEIILENKSNLIKSFSADLECKSKKKYVIYADTHLMDMADPLKPLMHKPAFIGLAFISAHFIVASLLAGKHSHPEIMLQPGNRIGLGDLKDKSHPLHGVFHFTLEVCIPRP